MTKTVDASFVTRWNKEAHLAFEEQKPAYWDALTKVQAPNSKTHNFPVFAASTSAHTGKTQGADVIRDVATTSVVSATIQPIYKVMLADEWDRAMMEQDYRNELSQQAAAAVWQSVEDTIITALGTTTSTETTLPTGNTFDFAGARKMSEAMSLVNVPKMNRLAIVSEGAITDLTTDSAFANNFHFQNDVVSTGTAKGVAGFDMYTSNSLGNGAGGSGERRCYFFHKDAFKVAINQDFKMAFDWDFRSQAWQVTASMLVGAAVVDSLGVQFCDVTN